MDIFVPFPLDGKLAIQQRMRAALGTIQSETGEEREYVSIFNHDVEALNNILNNPSSIYSYHEEALQKQAEYNAALADSKSRWDSDHKSLEIGKSVIKNLSERKKRFQYAVSKMEAIKKKSDQLVDMLSLDSQGGKFWHRLDALAERLDKDDKRDYLEALFGAAESLDSFDKGNRFNLLNDLIGNRENLLKRDVMQIASQKNNKKYLKLLSELDGVIAKRQQRLKKLKLDWQAQDIFVLSNSEDLLKVQTDLKNFKQFLDFIEKGASFDEKYPTDQKIQNIISINKNRLKRLEKALIQAMSWRIHAASLKKDLLFDDNRYALIQEIRKLIFLYDDPVVLEPVMDLLSLSAESLSTALSFENFELLAKHVKESGDQSAINKWKFSKWVKDEDKENAISVKRKGLNVIPNVLDNFVSKKPNWWSLGSLTRYYYFQTTNITKDLFGLLRRKFLGEHSEFLTLLNESIYQASEFIKTIDKANNTNKRLNLYLLSQSSAFKDALKIPEFIQKEKLKGRSLKPSWTVGYLLKWFPFLNRFRTYMFFNVWESTIDVALIGYQSNCRKIAEKIIQDYESALFESIQNKVFLLPNNLLVDMQKFVTEYGPPEMVDEFQRINQPLNILKKFTFLHPQNEIDDDRRLNEDSVHAFLTFAKKYWSKEQYLAAEEMMKVITREQVPVSDRDLTLLYKKTKILYTSKNKEKEFMFFLKYMAHEYIFLTGDQGGESSLKFLERFYPKAAKNWRNDRTENLDDKFVFIHAMLDVKPNFEKKIDPTKGYDVGQDILKYRLIGKYIQDLNLVKEQQGYYINTLCDKAREYLKYYQGGNYEYKDIILALGKIQPDIINQYLSIRFRWLLQQEGYNITEEEQAFYANALKSQSTQDEISELINKHYNGKSCHLDNLIHCIDNAQIKGVYLSKRLQSLMKKKSYEEIIATTLFEDISDNYVFIKHMNDYFDKIIQKSVTEGQFETLETEGFCHMIERYGSLVNKEAYRIMRLKQLLETNDYEKIQLYINTLLQYVKNLDKDLITLDKGKKLLAAMYESYVSEMEANNEWHAHVQYLLEHFSMGLCPDLLQKVRALWLGSFLSEPERFSELASINRPSLDLKYHQANKKVPNENTDLSKFYGKEINVIAELVDARLNQYTTSICDTMIQLLNRYLKDPGLRVLDDHHLHKKKMEDFQRARDIIFALKQNDYNLMFDLLDHFIEDYIGQQKLLDSEYNVSREAVIGYQAKILDSIYDAMTEQIKMSALSSDHLFSDNLRVQTSILSNMMGRASRSRLPDPQKEEILFLYEKNQEAYRVFSSIQSNLVLNRLHVLRFSGEDALLLRRYLSKTAKKGLISRVRIVMSILAETDPLYTALKAFEDLMLDESLNHEKIQERVVILDTFENNQLQLHQNVERLMNDIISKLQSGELIQNIPLFTNMKSSLQITFIQALSYKFQKDLQKAVFEKIQLIMTEPLPEDEISAFQEWRCYNMLCQWLSSSSSKLEKEFAKHIEPKVSQKLTEAKISFNELKHAMDDILNGNSKERLLSEWGTYAIGQKITSLKFNHETLEKERLLLQSAMLVRLFGNKKQILELDQLIASVLIRLRRAMMDGHSDLFSVHCIKFAEKLVTMAGNSCQQEQCAKLTHVWNQFITHDEISAGLLKSQALKDTLPAFLEKFNNDLFRYFIKRYNLSEDFLEHMSAMVNSWSFEGGQFDYKQVKKQYSFKNFKQWMGQYKPEKKLFVHHKAIDERAAQKMHIAFCLALQAHYTAWILKKRIDTNSLNSFSVELFTETLTEFNEKMMHDLSFKSHSLERHFRETIDVEHEYFVSWDLDKEKSVIKPPKLASTSMRNTVAFN